MNYSKFRFTLDIHKHQSQVSVPVMRGDTAVQLYIALTDGGLPYTIGESCFAIVIGNKPDGSTFRHPCIIEGGGTIIRYDFQPDTSELSGAILTEVRLYGTNGILTAPCFTIVVDERIPHYDGDVTAESISALDQIFLNEAVRVAAENERAKADKARWEYFASLYYPALDEMITIQDSLISLPALYKLNDDGESYTCIGGLDVEKIVIPATINDKPVTAVAQYAFKNYDKLRSITLPETIETIGAAAFEGCHDLANIYAPWHKGTVADAPWGATNAILLYSSTEGLAYSISEDGMQATCTGIGTATDTEIVIANTYNGVPVTSVGETAFSGRRTLTSITLPESIESVGTTAFQGCTALADIYAPWFEGKIANAPWGATSATIHYNKGTGDLSEDEKTESVDIVQTTGDSETAVMSQKAVTDALGEIRDKGTLSRNLFNKDTVTSGAYIYPGSGAITSSVLHCYSDLIPIEKGKTYTFIGDFATFGVNSGKWLASYDSNGNFIGAIKGTSTGATVDGTTKTTICNITIPDSDGNDWAFVRTSLRLVYLDTHMFVEGTDYPTKYIPFGFTTTLNEGIHLKEIHTKRLDCLYGKKLSCNGDSICAGAGASGGYATIIGDMYNMTVQNIGVNGGTITAEVYKSDGVTARHWICRTIENMDADADYAIVEGGVNDSSLAVPLGAITSDYGDTLDDSTFYGAFESMLKQLLIRFAGKKIGYIAVHQMSLNFRASNEKETSYYWAAKLCCEKWGVPFLDLNTTVPPFGLIRNTTSQAELYANTRELYTYNADGWHPNEEGYKKYYVPKIVAWLKTL